MKTVNGVYELTICCDGLSKIWLANPCSNQHQEVQYLSVSSTHPSDATYNWNGNVVQEFNVCGDLQISIDMSVRVNIKNSKEFIDKSEFKGHTIHSIPHTKLNESPLLIKFRKWFKSLIGDREIDSLSKLRILFNYLLVGFTWKLTPFKKPLDIILDSMSGDCGDLALLFAVACQAIGIPTRTVFGFLCDNQDPQFQHVWVESFLQDQGWMPIDVALAQETALYPRRSYYGCGIDDPYYYFGQQDPSAIVISRGFLFPKPTLAFNKNLITAETLSQSMCHKESPFVPLLAPYWIEFEAQAKPLLVHGRWNHDVKQ